MPNHPTPDTLDEEFRELEAAVLEIAQEDVIPEAMSESDVDEVMALMPDAEIENLSDPVKREPKGAGAGFWGTVSALAWVVVAVGAPVAFIGRDALQYQHPAVLVAIVAIALAPAILILYAAAAGRESRRVRSETAQLAILATEALAPTEEVEQRARNLGATVRAEIGALQSVVESALDRFAELEAAAARNVQVFDEAVSSARVGAGTLSQTLQSERIAFEDLTTELRSQSDVLGENVGRQIRLMREASRLVRQEYVAADETFQSHLTNFAATAALMAERTEAIDQAATSTQLASQRLDGTIVTALEALSQATTLTDTARQSAENATMAANATASAVRDTTQRAVADARRVAQMIRSETQAMEDSASATLAKLKDAADEARRASEEAQAAADRHAAAIQRRLSTMAGASQVAQAAQIAPKVVVEQAPVMVEEPMVAEKMYATAGGRPTRAAGVAVETVEAPRLHQDYTQDWSLPTSANDSDPAERFNLVEKSPAEKALEMLLQVGVRAGDVFATADLDFIANRARQGGASRRQAVAAAAPEAIARLVRLFEHNMQARADAAAFRAKPDLATQSGGKSVLIAYLLVDAALG